MSEVCGDNRFELIGEFKGKLAEGTNIETSPEEMAVLDNILFRFWQMGWLDLLKAQKSVVRCRDCKHYDRRCFTCENDVLLIKIDDCGCHPPFRVDEDWFCADGERRDSE